MSIRQDSILVKAVQVDYDTAADGLSFVSTQPARDGPGDGGRRSLAGTEVKQVNSSEIPDDTDLLASVWIPPSLFSPPHSQDGE